MFEQLCYENAVARRIESAVSFNTQEAALWKSRRDAYLIQAEIARASNARTPGSWAEPAKPFPPALLLSVEAPSWSTRVGEEAIQTITVVGRYVADPECELPPLPGPNPLGVTDVGPHNWGDVWAVGPRDTMPAGAIVDHQGRKLERVASWGPFQGRGYYREVK